MLLVIVSLAIAYIVCGVLSYGFTVGYFQRHYWEVRDTQEKLLAVAVAAMGPVGLLLSLVLGEFGYHGLLYTTTDSDWAKSKTLNMLDEEAIKGHNKYPDKMVAQMRELGEDNRK